MTKLIKNSTRKTTNRTHAICVAAPATPVKPSTPAMSPITKNVIDQLSIVSPPLLLMLLNHSDLLLKQLLPARRKLN
jgi:hypothetical protein